MLEIAHFYFLVNNLAYRFVHWKEIDLKREELFWFFINTPTPHIGQIDLKIESIELVQYNNNNIDLNIWLQHSQFIKTSNTVVRWLK